MGAKAHAHAAASAKAARILMIFQRKVSSRKDHSSLARGRYVSITGNLVPSPEKKGKGRPANAASVIAVFSPFLSVHFI